MQDFLKSKTENLNPNQIVETFFCISNLKINCAANRNTNKMTPIVSLFVRQLLKLIRIILLPLKRDFCWLRHSQKNCGIESHIADHRCRVVENPERVELVEMFFCFFVKFCALGLLYATSDTRLYGSNAFLFTSFFKTFLKGGSVYTPPPLPPCPPTSPCVNQENL